MDQTIDYSAVVNRPGLIWSCMAAGGTTRLVEDDGPPEGEAFCWLHLNLSDHRTQNWIVRTRPLPPAIELMFLAHEPARRFLVADGVVGLVLQDFEREFDADETARLGQLHVAVTPTMMLTGRYHPLATPDRVRRRIAGGASARDAATALGLLLDVLAESIAAKVHDIAGQLLAAEDELLADEAPPDTRELIGLRRFSAQLARMAAGSRATLQALADDPALPADLAPAVARGAQRMRGLEAEIAAAQAQLRLLRDELDLQAAQRTNQNLYFLSIMTALMMPATLVTGFFGMNTGGLPLSGHLGTLGAGLVAAGSSALTYFVLRAMGMVRN